VSEALQLRGLTKDFGDLRAVDGLDFGVHRGEMFALVGPDGAGKTTSMRLICGAMLPSDGEALVEGVGVTEDPERVKRMVGYMSQRFSLYGELSVAENLRFFSDLRGVKSKERQERSSELLAMTRLSEFTARRAEQLSGGMKQKLALACTLIHVPKVLLLDEPTTGVDPVSRREFWRILHNLKKRDVTILVSTRGRALRPGGIRAPRKADHRRHAGRTARRTGRRSSAGLHRPGVCGPEGSAGPCRRRVGADVR
jgi:ABC-2 type transport system ATP-binding protein